MGLIVQYADDGSDLPREVSSNPNIDWFSAPNNDDAFDDVFEDAFAPREPPINTAHEAPKMWTKFGEMEEDERMSVMEQISLTPSSPTQSPPNYGSSADVLFEGVEVEMLDTLDSDVIEVADSDTEVGGADAGADADADAGASAEALEQEGTIMVKTPDVPLSDILRVEFPESLLLVPRSCYEPFEPGVPIVKESEAVAQLFKVAEREGQDADDFVEFQLDDFAIYSNRHRFKQEMCSLHHLDTKLGHSNLLFDGKLSVGTTVFFVRGVPINALPIENYGTLSKSTVKDKIWIRSVLNSKREIYYRLNRPATEYRRFFDPFLWVADLAKHFVDYLKVMGEAGDDVTIFHFRSTFSSWLSKIHKTPEFVSWKKQHPNDDFRTSIIANLAFLHKEAIGVLESAKTYKHTLWAEIWEFQRYEQYPKVKKGAKLPKRSSGQAGSTTDETSKTNNIPTTVVTQYIYDCFSHQPFGPHLKAMPLSKKAQLLQEKLILRRHLELPAPIHQSAKTISTAGRQQIQDIKRGDTISTQRDTEESGSKWRRDISHGFDDVDRWLALVQRVHVDKHGQRTFDVIWYYRPVDTLCALMKYPWNNELFLSDHCSCDMRSKISQDEVLGVHKVEFGGTSATEAEFFCRQTYICMERKWVTLEKDHLNCSHIRKAPSKTLNLKTGETRLVIIDKESGRSEPCQFLTSYEEEGKGIYRFRKLLRRHQVEPASNTRPNELVYSYIEPEIEVRKKRILEPCYVRFYKEGEKILTPYDRDGVGDFFYFTCEEVLEEGRLSKSCIPLTAAPTSLRQGYDPSEQIPRLRGLDLFCGGGNFGRGLEDGGGIEMRWANDYNARAMHTYMANTSGPEQVSPFLGSIDDLQRLAIEGNFSDNVPPIGEVDFISGGSPCPGFSLLTNDKTTAPQRKNQSLVAAFASFIDLYRPRYGLLENVPHIVQRSSNRDQDVFSQLICAIVGLGYQAHFFFLDASSCGSPQRRSRVFLAFATPGHRLPHRPYQTHAHPKNTPKRSLGCLPTGEPMAERIMSGATPFGFVSAQAATADLPPVYDSKPDICVPYPDHRISLGITTHLRNKIINIPTRPWGMNFAHAWYGLDRKKAGSGVLTPAERLVFPEDSTKSWRIAPSSNSYGRQRPDRPIETIVTTQSPSDAKNGRTLHWRENRVLTIMEARRAQGFRDHEVLLGGPSDQYTIIGNSVAREVAVSLGVVFREAWVQSLADERHVQGGAFPTTTTTVSSVAPARMGVEVSPSINVEKLETPCSLKTQRKSRFTRTLSSSRSTTPTSTTSKRHSTVVEGRVSKSHKSDKNDSPSRATSTASSRNRLSRLKHSTTNE
ncbi:DNA (cytosine-5-)-methyltransferase [Fusarium austroafricanum]|uniref:DNA (cytosine-5-)-methyltransferase n=1 Tax=Fusarium austroafricanum TaxID=2364996 RepID=A0A8H4NZ20_9HYPO|nr:DNA (cytosine-5-)-methyltransferase [Fusarium austroafricanum]